MLELKNIKKDYDVGNGRVEALRGIDLRFRDAEFAAILGPSGCGKTTLLNIVGGLDQYSDGELLIDGRSTKEYVDSDWDAYRNQRVGFVFQSYNLIPHQSVLANVELAMTLHGVEREERRRRALAALEQVGLKDQIKKRPNQLSGGQMQRVAIARALVNNPEILLADEPTGALDSETSLQVMEILKQVAQTRLVVMVTHNPELAEGYATRIIRLLDGRVVADSDPCEASREEAEEGRKGKPSMSFRTALGLSLNNLMTKKGRTLLTAFAGSIGIIGIALILSLSYGVRNYIDRVQRETLASYPLEINDQTVDMTDTMAGVMGAAEEGGTAHGEDMVYSGTRMTQFMSGWMSGISENHLGKLKKYLEDESTGLDALVSGVRYEYNTPLTLYRVDEEGVPRQVNPATTMEATGITSMMNMAGVMSNSNFQSSMLSSFMREMNAFSELPEDEETLNNTYELLSGRMPETAEETLLILNSRNELNDYVLYTLWLKDQGELREQFNKLMRGETVEVTEIAFPYEEMMNLRFRMVLSTDLYEKINGVWVDRSGDTDYLKEKLENARELRVVGVARPAPGSVVPLGGTGVGYRSELMEGLMEQVRNSEIVQEQLANPEIDVFTGQPFGMSNEDLFADLKNMSVSQFLDKYAATLGINLDEVNSLMGVFAPFLDMAPKDTVEGLLRKLLPEEQEASVATNLKKMGYADPEEPSAIYIYPKDFASKKEAVGADRRL